MKSSKKHKMNSRICTKCHGKGTIGVSRYHQGRRFEYKVRDFLKERGWVVYRSYASKGIIDLLATKNNIKIGIQVKNRKTGLYLTPKEQAELVQFWNIFEDNSRDSFKMNIWKDNKITPVEFQGPIETILACSISGIKSIQWRQWDGVRWFDCLKLIKTGKL